MTKKFIIKAAWLVDAKGDKQKLAPLKSTDFPVMIDKNSVRGGKGTVFQGRQQDLNQG